MKKIILSLAVASLIFASCTKETTTSEITGNPGAIGFNPSTGKATRATVTTINGAGSTTSLQGDAAGFGVYGTKNNAGVQAEYIGNVDYIYNSAETKWEWEDPANPEMWPTTDAEYPMNFYAYHPVSATTGLAVATLSYPYTIGQNTVATPQQDLLAANKLNVQTRPTSSNVNLDFKHILSQVKFKVVGGTGMTVEVQSISVRNAGSVRTFKYGTNPMAWDGTAPTTNTHYPYVSAPAIAANEWNGDGSTANLVTGTSGSLMLIPQNFSTRAWDKQAAPDDHVAGVGGDTYIEVVYRMTETTGGKDVVGYTDATKHPQYVTLSSSETGNLFVKVGYPLDTNWEMGKTYTYTIYLGTPNSSGGNLVFDNFINDAGGDSGLPVVHPDTEEDIDVPEPIVDTTQPIDFIVKVGDWEDAAGISLQ
jgi:hypothetical protein